MYLRHTADAEASSGCDASSPISRLGQFKRELAELSYDQQVQKLTASMPPVQTASVSPAVQMRTVDHGYRRPSLPTKKKRYKTKIAGHNIPTKITGYEYRDPKTIPGSEALYTSGNSAAKPTAGNQYKGIELEDPKQNFLDDCYLIAGMSALAKVHPEVIKRAIQPVRVGRKWHYKVTLYKKVRNRYDTHYVTVDPSPLYARAQRQKGRPKLRQIVISKGGSAIAEGTYELPSSLGINSIGALTHSNWVAYGVEADGVKYGLATNGTPKADLTSNVQNSSATWPFTYKVHKHALKRAGAEGSGGSINELWPVVLEKAVAELLGGYQQLYKKLRADDAGKVISMLTGKDSDVVDKHQTSQTKLKKKVRAFYAAKRPMIALCTRRNKKLNLASSHYYTITDIATWGQSDILSVELRDPRGDAGHFGVGGIATLNWSTFYKHFESVVAGRV